MAHRWRDIGRGDYFDLAFWGIILVRGLQKTKCRREESGSLPDGLSGEWKAGSRTERFGPAAAGYDR